MKGFCHFQRAKPGGHEWTATAAAAADEMRRRGGKNLLRRERRCSLLFNTPAVVGRAGSFEIKRPF
jgi:hypothetical protein